MRLFVALFDKDFSFVDYLDHSYTADSVDTLSVAPWQNSPWPVLSIDEMAHQDMLPYLLCTHTHIHGGIRIAFQMSHLENGMIKNLALYKANSVLVRYNLSFFIHFTTMINEKVVPKEITVISKGALVAQASRSVMSRTDKILVFSGQAYTTACSIIIQN